MYVADFVYDKNKDDADLIYKVKTVLPQADRLLWGALTETNNWNKQISSIADELKVSFFDKVKLVCDNEKNVCSAFTDDGYKTLFDYGHWTLEGAKLFGSRLVEKGFDELLN